MEKEPGMTQREKNLCLLAGALALLGAVLWFLPGVRFSACLSFCLAGLCLVWLLLGRWAGKSRAGRWCRRGFALGLTALAVVLCAFEVVIVTYGREDWSALPVDAVIVLGAGVNGETPSMALQTRIQAAADYLELHPGVSVVLSGGQGPGEDISEAEAMRRALETDSGAENARYLLEDRSTSTAENFAYSKALLRENGIDTDTASIAVVTNDFHCFRAHLIAQRSGLNVVDIPAEMPWWLGVNYYLREPFALVKTLIFDRGELQ
jgi:uncharacterized SAM-binding protein YcdF (DUF218 family)